MKGASFKRSGEETDNLLQVMWRGFLPYLVDA